ncbi:MAG: AMP-binding protein [Paludibacter sp.]|nr:AMP-binding protein [Bacteroidales bacterium]MCM1068750.1 AMP-binding protein [Prevotella sp.]MCM1354462.1 AMP-binding protein [Bacteroides sp.]MCM1443265.1 AMP-binding protein [Muribaculum sp.]MCM1481050.1 AMP-binding protein [Paludibacter sp.]
MTERLTIIDFVEKYTRQFADHTFLREKTQGKWTETSFRQTRHEAYRIGAGLMQLGLQKGDKVALLSEGRNLWVLGELGILYAGGVNVPLSIKLEETNDLLFRIRHSDARYIMVSGQQLPKIRAILPKLENVEHIIVFDSQESYEEKEIYLGDILRMGDQLLEQHPDDFTQRYQSVQPDDYANISYTSGTTADPKGILLTHRNYTANVEQAHSVIGIDVDDVMLIILPLDHCFAHVAGFYTMMSYGGSIATVPTGKTALATLKNIPIAIQEVRPMVMLSVPALARNFKKNIETGIHKQGAKVEALYNFALRLAISYNKEYYNRGGFAQAWKKPLIHLFDRLIFKQVRAGLGGRMKFFVGGGALLDIELQRYYNAIGIPMFQGYGLSEATPIICANAPENCIFGSSGRLVQPMDIKICDAEGNSLPYGEKGEIVIRGENVMAGYWKNPDSTAETVIDGWLHTGDMGYITAQHPDFLWVTGRFKSLLIASDGEKYSPEGFEDSLTDSSKYIEQVILHNNQDPYTIVLIVPNKDALQQYAKAEGKNPESEEGKRLMLDKIQAETDAYRKGGIHAGMFPERWLPTAVVVLPEPFTEQNHMVNSTMKIVRGKVETYYADRIEYAYTLEGKNLYNPQNLSAI